MKVSICERGHRIVHNGSIKKGSRDGIQIPKHCQICARKGVVSKIVEVVEK